MSHDTRSISLTPRMHKRLTEKVKLLEEKRNEEEKALRGMYREEKDPSGNAGYEEARRQIDLIQGQIDDANDKLNNAVIVPEDNSPISTVTVGKKVVLHLHYDDEKECTVAEVVIDGVCEYCGEDTRVLTPESPIGMAVIGAGVGDKRQCLTPNGSLINIVIVSVTNC